MRTAQANRQAAVAQAEAIIDAGVQSFMHWMELRSPATAAGGVVPLIQQLNAQADEWRAAEIARAKKLLAKGEDVDAVLEALSRGLAQKMLHEHPGRAARGRRRKCAPRRHRPSRACSCARKAKTASSGARPLTRRSDFQAKSASSA